MLTFAYFVLVGAGAIAGTWLTSWAEDTWVGRLDIAVSRWLADHRSSTGNTLSDIGSGFADTLSVVLIFVVLGFGFWLVWRRWDEITLLATALALEVTSFVTIAYVVGRDRPPVEQLDVSPPTSGFPSGHTAAAMALYFGLVVIILAHARRPLLRTTATFIAAAIVVIVALSRMYRGMHFVTDVTAGALLGASCLFIAWRLLGSSLPARIQEES